MPVEITLPLSPLEQAVADARENERKCALIVEDLKLQLKTAKATWEESVEEMKNAVDEMIADKRQPALPGMGHGDDDGQAGTGGENPDPNPPAPPAAPTGQPEQVAVTFIEPALLFPPAEELRALPPAVPTVTSTNWRELVIAEQLDGPSSLFDTLAAAGVTTMGELCDGLLAGKTYDLPLLQVHDLQEAIEDVSSDDPEPVKFGVHLQESGPGASEPEPEAEPAEPAKPAKKRGRKKKAAEPEATEPAAAPDFTDL